MLSPVGTSRPPFAANAVKKEAAPVATLDRFVRFGAAVTTLGVGRNEGETQRQEIRTFEKEIAAFEKTLRRDPVWKNTHKGYLTELGLNGVLFHAQNLMQEQNIGRAHDVLRTTTDKIRRIQQLRQAQGSAFNGAKAIDAECLFAPIPNFHEVLPGRVYRGSQPTRGDIGWLRNNVIINPHGFKTIINLRDPDAENDTGFAYRYFRFFKERWTLKEEADYARANGMNYFNLPIPDRSVPTPETLNRFFQIVYDPKNWPIYIHCASGIGRTGIMSAMLEKVDEPSRPNLNAYVSRRALDRGLEPKRHADHALQLAFIQNYQPKPYSELAPVPVSEPPVSEHPLMKRVLSGEPVVLYHGPLDTSGTDRLLQSAIDGHASFEIDGNLVDLPDGDGGTREYFVNAHHQKNYDRVGRPYPYASNPDALNPMRFLPPLLAHHVFTKFDFKAPAVIDTFGALSRAFPFEQKMGHILYAPLRYGTAPLPLGQETELFSVKDLERLKRVLGENVPLKISCTGLGRNDLNDALLADVAKKIAGRAQFVNFNLPNDENIPAEFARAAWMRHGIIPEIKIKSPADARFWNAQHVPYIGVTDDVSLATPL